MRFQAKPFAVEVKRNRKNTARPLLIDTAPQAPAEPPPTAARALAESLFGSFRESSEPSGRTAHDGGDRPSSSPGAGAPAVAADAEIAPARRILPDLRPDQAKTEAKQEAEARSPAREPRARRRRVGATEVTAGSDAQAEPVAKKSPPPKKPKIKSERTARITAPVPSTPVAAKAPLQERRAAVAPIQPRQQSNRSARKAVEGPASTGLRRGERWKRRLPRVLW